jgi:hypothetical protein
MISPFHIIRRRPTCATRARAPPAPPSAASASLLRASALSFDPLRKVGGDRRILGALRAK